MTSEETGTTPAPEAWDPTSAPPFERRVARTGGLFERPGDPWTGLPRSAFSFGDVRHVVAGIIVGVAFLIIFGGTILSFIVSLQSGGPGGGEVASGSELAGVMIIQLLLFVIPPFAWAALVYGDVPNGFQRRLLLDFRAWWRPLGIGAGAAVIFLVATSAVLFVVEVLLPRDLPENELALEIGRGITPALIFLLAFTSAAGEELFFRAFLQRRLGVVATSVVFGLVHIQYWNVLQILIPVLLGFLFSWLMMRYRTVLAPFAAHFTFNFLQLTLLYFVDEGTVTPGLAGLFAPYLSA